MPVRSPTPIRTALVLALLGMACSTTNGDPAAIGGESVVAIPVPAARRDSAAEQPPATDTAGGQAVLARLERNARALARTTGCTSVDACRTAPVGVRACGGPRTYLVYCAATTDTVALFRALRALESAERAHNERSGMMSTCEFRSPPAVALTGGSCRETPASGELRVP